MPRIKVCKLKKWMKILNHKTKTGISDSHMRKYQHANPKVVLHCNILQERIQG